MTREERIQLIKHLKYNHSIGSDYTITDKDADEIIKALEQEPKTGNWIYDDEYSDWFDVTYGCSCCKRTIIVPYEARNEVYKDYPYCHCGARMVDP